MCQITCSMLQTACGRLHRAKSAVTSPRVPMTFLSLAMMVRDFLRASLSRRRRRTAAEAPSGRNAEGLRTGFKSKRLIINLFRYPSSSASQKCLRESISPSCRQEGLLLTSLNAICQGLEMIAIGRPSKVRWRLAH